MNTTDGIKYTHADDTTLEVHVCPSCGVTYALPTRLVAQRRKMGGNFYCPNGHSLSFTETDADRLKKEAAQLRKKLDDEKANAAWWRDRNTESRKQVEHEQARANGYKGALTKVKKRVGNGVCPCCNRSFVDLGRHMASKHPAFTEPCA